MTCRPRPAWMTDLASAWGVQDSIQHAGQNMSQHGAANRSSVDDMPQHGTCRTRYSVDDRPSLTWGVQDSIQHAGQNMSQHGACRTRYSVDDRPCLSMGRAGLDQRGGQALPRYWACRVISHTEGRHLHLSARGEYPEQMRHLRLRPDCHSGYQHH